MPRDLTTNQATALRVLAQQEFPTVSEVAEIGRMPRPSTMGAVAALVTLGFASAAGTGKHGGRTYTITGAGRAALEE